MTDQHTPAVEAVEPVNQADTVEQDDSAGAAAANPEPVEIVDLPTMDRLEAEAAVRARARTIHYLKNLPFHEHLTRLSSEDTTKSTSTGKSYIRTAQPHEPRFLRFITSPDYKEDFAPVGIDPASDVNKPAHSNHPDDADAYKKHFHRHAPRNCGCHSCVGFRLHTFCQDLAAWSVVRHHTMCVAGGVEDGEQCTIFCPGTPTEVGLPASLTIPHLEEARQFGWDVDAVLKALRREEFKNHIALYMECLHTTTCAPITPCRSWCYKTAEQITAREMGEARKVFPEWQRRMLASPGGMGKAMRDRKLKKKEREKFVARKVERLGKEENRWSEAPVEMAEELGVWGVGRRVHGPTCCVEKPCVSLCVCFPEVAH